MVSRERPSPHDSIPTQALSIPGFCGQCCRGIRCSTERKKQVKELPEVAPLSPGLQVAPQFQRCGGFCLFIARILTPAGKPDAANNFHLFSCHLRPQLLPTFFSLLISFLTTSRLWLDTEELKMKTKCRVEEEACFLGGPTGKCYSIFSHIFAPTGKHLGFSHLHRDTCWEAVTPLRCS